MGAKEISINEKKERAKDLILGILNFTGKIPKVKLAKLLMFTEIEHFNRTGDSYTGLYFVRLRKGPLLAFFDDILNEGENSEWTLEREMVPIYEEGRAKKQLSFAAKKNVELPTEIKTTIRKVLAKYERMTGTQLSLESHKRPAWKYAEPNEPIYVAELAVKNDEEYFALVDLIEDLEDDDDTLEEEISQNISRSQKSV